jgi:RHS repeat-associated protein
MGSSIMDTRHSSGKGFLASGQLRDHGVLSILSRGGFVQFALRVLLMTTLVALACFSLVRADQQGCNDPDGPTQGAFDPDCPPTVNSVSPILTNVDTYVSPAGDTQYTLTFNVVFSGSGHHGNNASPFRIEVYAQVPGYAPEYVGGANSNTDYLNAYNACVTLSGNLCHVETIPSWATQRVDFWAKACETSSNNCHGSCTSSPVPVDGPWGSGTTPGLADPRPEELGPMPCEMAVDDPINVTNGNMYVERVDVELPTDLGVPLALTRHFNTFGSSSGSLGSKWRYGLEYSIAIDSMNTVTLTESTGRAVVFHQHLLDVDTIGIMTTYDAPYGIPYKLDVDTTNDAYTIILPNNSKLLFQGEGPVDSIQDLAGSVTKLYYTSGVLDSVKNASGRKVVFAYASGQLSAIKSGAGDTLVQYAYDTTIDMLSRATFPDGTWEEYTYGTNAYDDESIVNVTTSDGVSRTYEYDTTGRATHVHSGDSVKPVDLAWSIAYTSDCNILPPPDTFKVDVDQGDNVLMSDYYFTWSPGWSKRQVTAVVNNECGGCATAYEYDGNGMKQTVTYANGTQDEFRYNAHGNMISREIGANTSLAQWTHWAYDSTFFHLPTVESRQSVANPDDSSVAYYHYDSDGNLDTLIETGWLTDTTEYTDTSTFRYNASGQVTRVNGPRRDVADTIEFVYYGNGDLQYQILPNGDTTTFGERNSLGHRTWVRSANGDTTRYTFDAKGQLTNVIYASHTSESTMVTMTYDADGRVTSVSNFGGSGLTMEHDAAGYLEWVEDKVGSLIGYIYDSVGNPIREGVYESDSTLRKLKTSAYNTRHQLEDVYDPDSNRTGLAYDDAGNLTTLRNALGDTTKYVYDSLSRLVETIEPDTTDGIRTQFEYNSLNRVAKVTDPSGFEYVHRYDDKGRLVYDSSAVAGVTRYSYDPANNLIMEINAANDTIEYEYDALNRLTARLYPDGQDVYYIYDGPAGYGRGRLYKECAAACTTTYRYDIRGRVDREYRTVWNCAVTLTGDVNQSGTITSADINYLVAYVNQGGPAPLPCAASGDVNCTGSVTNADVIYLINYVFKSGPSPCDVCPLIYSGTWDCITSLGKFTTYYDYDRNDNLISISYPSPSGGAKVYYDYDSTDNVIRVRLAHGGTEDTLATDLAYAPFGAAESWQLSNGLVVQNSLNSRYLTDDVDAIAADSSDSVVAYTYTFDATGKITAIDDILDASQDRTFVYDKIGRLTRAASADYPDTAVLYKYYKNGNRDRVITLPDTGGLLSYYYYYEDNRLDSIRGDGSATFSYDPLGNVVQAVTGATTTYEYNDAGRLVSIDSGAAAIYEYDGQHRRVRKINGSDTLKYYPAASGQPLTEYINSRWVRDYIYLNGRPFAQIDSLGEVLYFINDHLGTPLVLVDSAKTVRWSADWYPFGEIYDEQVSAANNIRFPGQWRDEESGLNYNWHRYYSPAIGRYMQADPARHIEPGIPHFLTEGGQWYTEEINLYVYALNDPLALTDPTGLMVSNCDCTQAAPVLSSSPKCDLYGDEAYLGVSLKCFCKCAGDSPWSQRVRGCLACEHGKGTNPFTAHIRCYFAGGWLAPVDIILKCNAKCSVL